MALTVWGAEPVTDPVAVFYGAKGAYDTGRFDDAATAYEQLLATGFDSAEIWYNLGNVRVRQGDLGQAALAYERAARRLPRDPDIRANLDRTRQLAGASIVPAGRIVQWAEKLTPSEWARMGRAGYVLAFAIGCLMAVVRRIRAVGFRILVLCLAVAAAGGTGWGLQWISERNPEWVIVAADGVDARFAPLPDSAIHYHLPVASVVRKTGESGTWTQIRLGKNIGWIPARTAEPVAVPSATPEMESPHPGIEDSVQRIGGGVEP